LLRKNYKSKKTIYMLIFH